MKTAIFNWISGNADKIVEIYPDSRLFITFLLNFFYEIQGLEFINLVEKAAVGYGVNTNSDAEYCLKNDIADSHVIEPVEFYFDGELAGRVSIESYLKVLGLVVSKYCEFYPLESHHLNKLFAKAELYLQLA